MAHFIDDMQDEAEAALAAMRDASRVARSAHARAELMRHMLTTARKAMHRPRIEAVEAVVGEWMAAWHLDRTAWPHIEREMVSFTQAIQDYAASPTDEADAAVRRTIVALDDVLEREGTNLADQMAWRSQCAHGWWAWVEPVPADLPGAKERPIVPALAAGRPFWDTGCADFCR